MAVQGGGGRGIEGCATENRGGCECPKQEREKTRPQNAGPGGGDAGGSSSDGLGSSGQQRLRSPLHAGPQRQKREDVVFSASAAPL